MAVTANGQMVLNALGDLRDLFESESQYLHEQFSKYKKYNNQLIELEQWEKLDTNGFIDTLEKDMKKNRFNKDSEYRLAVYVGRYPSLFITLGKQEWDREAELKERLKQLMLVEESILNYVAVLEELE